MQLYRHVPLLELVNWLITPSRIVQIFVILTVPHLSISDAPDLYGSTFFKDQNPESGLGGWGDPAHDFEVPTGGFSNFHLSYPSSHILRRNFTLQPYLNSDSPFFSDRDLMANTTFTQAEVRKMVEGFEGDYKGFQKYFENFGVRVSVNPAILRWRYLAPINDFLHL